MYDRFKSIDQINSNYKACSFFKFQSSMVGYRAYFSSCTFVSISNRRDFNTLKNNG